MFCISDPDVANTTGNYLKLLVWLLVGSGVTEASGALAPCQTFLEDSVMGLASYAHAEARNFTNFIHLDFFNSTLICLYLDKFKENSPFIVIVKSD